MSPGLAARGARLNLPALLWGQAAISAVQLMAQYSNEFFDLAADRANPTPTAWSGGSRVLVEGRLSPAVALAAAVGLAIAKWRVGILLALSPVELGAGGPVRLGLPVLLFTAGASILTVVVCVTCLLTAYGLSS